MRIKMNDLSIEEFVSVDFIRAYECEGASMDLFLQVGRYTCKGFEWDYIGEYDMEKITEEDALENAQYIIDKLMNLGFVDSDKDFKEFIWY